MNAHLRAVPDAPDDWIDEVVRLDQQVDTYEENAAADLERHRANIAASLRVRWETGHVMLAQRVGKKLPPGTLDELVERTGKSRRELQFRMQFAEANPTEDALCNVLHNVTSWHQITQSLAPARDPKPKTEPESDYIDAEVVDDDEPERDDDEPERVVNNPNARVDPEDVRRMDEAEKINYLNAVLDAWCNPDEVAQLSTEARHLMVKSLKSVIRRLEQK